MSMIIFECVCMKVNMVSITFLWGETNMQRLQENKQIFEIPEWANNGECDQLMLISVSYVLVWKFTENNLKTR